MTDETLLELMQKYYNEFALRSGPALAVVMELVRRGIYPEKSKMGHEPKEMVMWFGPDWYKYREPLNCPHCNANLRDEEHGPPGKREIGVYSRELDRTMFYTCPDCGRKL